MILKQRFLEAVVSGELGIDTEVGVIVSLSEFKTYFKDVNACYTNAFLSAATIEYGQHRCTHTHYVFRIHRGVYLVHSDAVKDVWEGNNKDTREQTLKMKC